MWYSNNPVADYDAYDIDLARRMREMALELPFCHDCGKPLYEGEYQQECGKYFCEDCFALYLREGS